ncbi:hypothetical protein [Streptosporangium roseum]|uniref:hypothetical protein n=1 Tax=Streptosporangium roseum TaxID=2001 RepID=UPI003320878B
MTLGRLDFSWSADGTLVWEPGVDPSATKKFYDLEGNPRPAPPEVARTHQEAGMSPGGPWVAAGSSDTIATTAVKNVSTGQVRPLRPVGGYRIERLAAWADEGHLFAWACELKGIQSCSISDFRTRLILVDVDGGKAVPLSAYRSSTNDPRTWTPVFSRR